MWGADARIVDFGTKPIDWGMSVAGGGNTEPSRRRRRGGQVEAGGGAQADGARWRNTLGPGMRRIR